LQGNVAADEIEAALQAEAPDVAGLAQAGHLRHGCCLHFLNHNEGEKSLLP
jgi:hypothetical protein